jgi:antitoxin (DNA-binding transcriptional repressor) of toxin-antitoxin stability system
METKVTATELVRTLGDVLGRVRFRGESFVIERNGRLVARLVPIRDARATSLRDALAAWQSTGEPDGEFAVDLDRVGSADSVPADAWDS